MFQKISTFAATAAAALLLSATTASALSCVQPNFAEQFNRFNDAPELYYVGYGTLRPLAPVIAHTPPFNPDGQTQDRSVTTPYLFTGGFLTGQSITGTANYSVSVTTRCLGPWCGGMPQNAGPQLVFIEGNGPALSLEIGPCPGPLHATPSAGQVQAIQDCMKDNECGPREVRAFDLQALPLPAPFPVPQ